MTHRLAWLAGIIDGEGCISASYKRTPRGVGLDIRVSIANTDERLLAEVGAIATSLDIKYLLYCNKPKDVRHRPVWHLSFDHSKRACAILSAVLPYMIGKKDQALLLLQVISHRRSTMWSKGRQGPTSVEGDEWLRRQLDELKNMHHVKVQA